MQENERDLLIASLWDAGATGITEEPRRVARLLRSRERIERFCSEHFADFKPPFSEEEDHDWVRLAQDQWQPFPVGERFYLGPGLARRSAPEGDCGCRMHPGMACGSGTHPATRLCLMAMERHVRPGQTVFSTSARARESWRMAARLLGARPVFGCDIEHDSPLVARTNLEASIGIFTGSRSVGKIQMLLTGPSAI